MKTHLIVATMLALALLAACKKNVTAPVTPVTQEESGQFTVLHVPFPTNYSRGCPTAPNYGDTLIYPQAGPKGGDYIVKPVNQQKGTYMSWPEGLQLDSRSGEINVTQSETGARYFIGFVKEGTTDTCIAKLAIAGATYKDGIYVLANNDTLITPYFNADHDLTSICGQGGGCQFYTKPNDPLAWLLSLLSLDKSSGTINLKQTFENKLFGSYPRNGTRKKLTIFYRLNDRSGKAEQKITINLIYYDRAANVPLFLIDKIDAKGKRFASNDVLSLSTNPRPPQIIVTSY